MIQDTKKQFYIQYIGNVRNFLRKQFFIYPWFYSRLHYFYALNPTYKAAVELDSLDS